MNRKILHATSTIYNNIKFRSKLEASFAKYFDKAHIEYQYEPFKIILLPKFKYYDDTIRSWSYTPDFVLKDNIIIEAKGFCNDVWANKKKMILKYIVDHDYNYKFHEVHSLIQLKKVLYNEGLI